MPPDSAEEALSRRGAAAASTAATAALPRSSPCPRRSSRPRRRRAPRHRRRSGGRCSTSRASRASPSASSRSRPTSRRLDQPRRLHQQDRRLGPRRGARLRRDGGLAAQVARRPRRAAHRDGDRRDEPRPAPRPARPQLGLPARAAVPDRHALRPVRDAGARGNRLLHLLGLTVRARRHAVRDLALPRGRRPPVALDARDRDRDTGPDVRRALLRTRARMAAARRARAACRHRDGEALYLRLSTTPIDQAPFTAAVARVGEDAAPGRRRRRRLPAPRARPSDDRVVHRRLRRDRARGARGGRRCSPRRKASRRPCSASRRPTGCTATGRRAGLRPLHGAAPRARRTSSGSSHRTSAACPSSP